MLTWMSGEHTEYCAQPIGKPSTNFAPNQQLHTPLRGLHHRNLDLSVLKAVTRKRMVVLKMAFLESHLGNNSPRRNPERDRLGPNLSVGSFMKRHTLMDAYLPKQAYMQN